MEELQNPISITEENNKADIDQWFQDAAEQTFDTLPEFIRHVMNDYYHDYGTVCHAISACAVATAWACTKMDGACGGITGFQAGFVMWGFIRHWTYTNNKCGMKLLDYDNLLFPQYGYKFEKTISEETWRVVQTHAKSLLSERIDAHPAVIEHWKSIVDGNLPFGFKIGDD